MDQREISVIIPTYNSVRTLSRCLSSLSNQSVSHFEVLVVDGGSKDGTLKIAKAFPNVLTINARGHYPGASRNLGAKNAKADILLFLDSDCEADQALIERHLRAYYMNDNLDGVQGIIRSASHSRMARVVESEFLTQFWFDNLNNDGTIKFFTGAVSNLSLNKRLFLKNNFSDDLPSCDDIELHMKLRARNVKVLFEPRAVIYHHHPSSLKELFDHRKWYGEGFVHLMAKYASAEFRKNSMFDTSKRYLVAQRNELMRMVFEDHRELCNGCSLRVCCIKWEKLPVKSAFDAQYLRQITCLGIAAGVLRKRTGLSYEWPAANKE